MMNIETFDTSGGSEEELEAFARALIARGAIPHLYGTTVNLGDGERAFVMQEGLLIPAHTVEEITEILRNQMNRNWREEAFGLRKQRTCKCPRCLARNAKQAEFAAAASRNN